MIAPLLAAASLLTTCYLPPVPTPVSVPFVAPACRWCPGHRGLEYRTDNGTPVRAVAAGVVTFAGSVAGTRYVVVLHTDGLRATYGMLATLSLTSGVVVQAGTTVGYASHRLYFGLRATDDRPVDPTPMLGTALTPPRLVPTDGTPGRAPGAARSVCAVSATRVARPP